MAKPTSEELREEAQEGSVEGMVSQWYRGDQSQALKDILRIGYRSEAQNYLVSMTPEKMFRRPMPGYRERTNSEGLVQVGSYSRGQRLTAARRFADMAGVPLEEIARECGLEEMLSVSPEPEPDPLPRQ